MSAFRRRIATTTKSVAYRSGLQALFRRICPSRWPVVLRYHSVSDGESRGLISDGIRVSPAAFAEQARYFARHFRVISMSELVDCVRRMRPFPKNAMVLTFDDGYADNYEAARVLQRYGLTGVFYITVDSVEAGEKFWVSELRHRVSHGRPGRVRVTAHGETVDVALPATAGREPAIRTLTHLIKTVDVKTRDDVLTQLRQQLADVPPFPPNLMLTWTQLREMAALGMEIGGHTMTHCNLPSAQEDEAWFEISECGRILAERVGTEVRHFAYPNGGSPAHYNDRVKELVSRAGFHSSCTSHAGLVGPDHDLFAMRRIRATERIEHMLWEIEEARLRVRNQPLRRTAGSASADRLSRQQPPGKS